MYETFLKSKDEMLTGYSQLFKDINPQVLNPS